MQEKIKQLLSTHITGGTEMPDLEVDELLKIVEDNNVHSSFFPFLDSYGYFPIVYIEGEEWKTQVQGKCYIDFPNTFINREEANAFICQQIFKLMEEDDNLYIWATRPKEQLD